MDGLFNNREIAAAIWMLVFFVWILTIKGVRKSIGQVMVQFFNPSLFIPLFLSFIPALAVVILLYWLKLWDLSVLKETIYWFIGSGLAMSFRMDKIKSLKQSYKDTVKDVITLLVVLEFFINFYVFPIWVELILLPTITVAVVLSTFARYQKGDEKALRLARGFFDGIIAIIGVAVLIFAFMEFLNKPTDLFTYENLELFLLPIALSFAHAPSVYLLALYSKYELAFNRIRYNLSLSKRDKWTLRLAVIKRCGSSIKTTSAIIPYLSLHFIDKPTKTEALKLIRTFDPSKPLYP